MKTATPVRGRTPVKKEHITSHLRQLIVSGDLTPGTRLPTRTDLEESFQTSPATVQSALDSLVRDGFVRVQGRQGTFVAEDLPFLTRYGFVFPRRPDAGASWPRFFTAIATELARLNASGDVDFPSYSNINEVSSDGWKQLQHDINARRLAGLVFIAEATEALRHAPLNGCGLPMACIADKPDLGVPRLYLESRAVIDRALDYLVARGKTRVAVAHFGDWLKDYGAYLDAALAKRGMSTQPYWMQSFHYTYPEGATNCMNLLMRSRAIEPFDAIYIADDNIVSAAVEGVVAAGMDACAGVDIVAHCNFPLIDPSPVPVKRIGFDAKAVVAAAIDIVNSQRDGCADQHVTIHPVFDHELLGGQSSPNQGARNVNNLSSSTND
ncbi:MAG TPA: GntR family transcriptional regulator [Capsulimonadaceae bacterium]|jgi:DNA-binding LacI/PurR family transcriptional regulator